MTERATGRDPTGAGYARDMTLGDLQSKSRGRLAPSPDDPSSYCHGPTSAGAG
ncbi:MAG: hypothetical protein AAGF71_13295 [Pseudomonadota bacterium]